jgi:pyrroline-5-carboxylate reductase
MMNKNNQFQIGFLGLGNMGSSILKGILSKNVYQKEDISFYAPSDATKENYTNLGLSLASDERALCEDSQIIVLAIKPQVYDSVFEKIKDLDFNNKTIISLAPGKSISYLETIFPGATIVRAMPNTPALIGKAATTLAYNKEEHINEIKTIFASIGNYVVMEERLIDEVIPLNGSMPAYLFEFAKNFIDLGVQSGLDYKSSYDLVFQAIIGSCLLALDSHEDVDTLINNVCSKGGSTIAGLNQLRENQFKEAITKCYKACVKRSKELAKV